MSDPIDASGAVPSAQPNGQVARVAAAPAQPPMEVNTTELKSTYCNVCSASSTREEVVLNFGINQNWDLRQPKMDVALHHRIIMSPAAAKRFYDVLTQLIKEHESRHGSLS